VTDLKKRLQGKTVLITGGTGSFGKTVAHDLLASDVGEIRIFSRDELKQELMRIEYANPKLKFISAMFGTGIPLIMPCLVLIWFFTQLH